MASAVRAAACTGTAESAAANLASLCPIIVQRYAHEADMAELCTLLPALGRAEAGVEEQFLALWHVYSGAAARQPMPPLS